MDTIVGEQEAVRIYQETESLIHSILPDATVFAFSSQYERGQQLKDIKEFIQSIKTTRNLEDRRLAKLLYFIRTIIANLLQKRIDVEDQLVESIRWNEEMYTKLNGAVNQVKDTEVQKNKSDYEILPDNQGINSTGYRQDSSSYVKRMLCAY